MTIEQRVERLERQNCLLKRTLIMLVGAAAIACAVGVVVENEPVLAERATAAATVVQAGRFEVVDSNGNVVAAMSMNRDRTGGVVFTNNQRGALVAQMGAADDERGVVWTYDHEGYRRRDRH